jgi:hypothetical protein
MHGVDLSASRAEPSQRRHERPLVPVFHLDRELAFFRGSSKAPSACVTRALVGLRRLAHDATAAPG